MPEITQESVSADTTTTPEGSEHALGYPGNVVDAAVPAAKISQLNTQTDALYGTVNSIKVPITPEQLKRLPRVGPQNLEFARAVVERLKNHAEMGGDLISAAQLLIDLGDVENLTPVYHKIKEIEQVLRERIQVAEGELYQGSLVAYHNNHARAELGDATAKEIDKDLKVHFSKIHKNHGNKKPTRDESVQTEEL